MTSKNSAPLASYIDLLLDVVCAVDSQGRFVFVSAACEQVFGYTPDELIGQPMIDMVHPADRQRTLEAAQALEAAGFTDVAHVVHGFEGELNEQFKRSSVNGWRFEGLPWEQM